MIITQTPFRMSFFGGGTDMESFFRENGGAVLSTTFDKYCYVNVRHLPRFFDYSTELSYSKTERVTCMSMLENFFDIRKNSRKLFEGLEIAEHQALCDAWMNQYPTISISFRQIDGLNFMDKTYF